MLVYKVTFLNNKIISCGVTDPLKYRDMKDDVYVSRNNGLLIFALIKANSKAMALEKAAQLAADVSSNDKVFFPDIGSISLLDHLDQPEGPVSTQDFIDTTGNKKNLSSLPPENK